MSVSILGIATFAVVAASGTTMTYQWQKNGTNIPSATQSIFIISNAQLGDQGSYTVKITNGGGTVTSAAVSLVVQAPPLILTQPVSQVATQGQSISFSVGALGTAPVSYLWSLNGVAVPGPAGAGATLTLNAVTTNNAGNYAVVVTDSLGSVTSTTATLAVLVPPAIAPPQQPQNLTATQGQTVSFSVAPTGTAPLSYQWKFNGSILSGATNAILTIANVQPAQAGSYTAAVTNLAGSVTSAAATLTVNFPPAITTQPVSLTATQGQNTSFSVVALGTAPISYQWSLNGVAVPGPAGASATLTLNAVTSNNAGNYTVVVTDPLGSVTSAVATLTVLAPPAIAPPQQPQNQTVSPGQSASFTVVATGTAPLNYQWNFNGSPISGATGSALTIANVQVSQVGSYTVVVTNIAGSVTSAAATLALSGPPLIITQPQSAGVSKNSAASFSVSATGTAPLTYQWSINGTPVPGPAGGGTTYSVPKAMAPNAGNYSVVVANSLGSVTSAVAVLTVNGPPIILSQPTNQSVLVGQSGSFSVAATGVTPVAFQWYFNGSSISGAASSAFAINPATTNNTGSYKVVLTNPNGSVTSSVVTLVVSIPPTITAQPQNQAVVAGQPVVFTASASGTGPLGYQWNFNGAPLAGKTNLVLAITNALPSLTGSYSLMVTNSGGSTTSAPAALVVTIPPVTLSAAGGAHLGMTASGFSLQFSVPVGCTYVVLASTDLLTWKPIATNIAATASVAFTDSDATNYGSRYYRIMAH